MSPQLSVWHVSREYAGLAEAGGVKDVVRGLAEAHARAGTSPRVVLPLYGFMRSRVGHAESVARFAVSLPDHDRGNTVFHEPVEIRSTFVNGVHLLLVDSPRFSALRDVYTYTAEDEKENHWRKKGTGHWDFHQLNLILQRSALETALALGERPDVFHCHDGHTAFLPALMREDARYATAFGRSAAVVTIHNAGAGYHQEVWDPGFAALLTGLPAEVIQRGLLKGTADPLLLAGAYARLVTVSEQYATELLAERADELSGGLGRACREKGIPLAGITNGIDPEPWDPRRPDRAGLPFGFDPGRGDLVGKRKCRDELAARLGRTRSEEPLFAFVGRLTEQKGIDVLFHALEELLRQGQGKRFIVLGTGRRENEEMLAQLASRPSSGGRLAFVPHYDPPLASLIYAASDFFLVPSAYEPCGLTDFIAQIMGSVPIVHGVGGLVKVRDGQTGFSHVHHGAHDLAAAVERAAQLGARDPAGLDAIRRRAFAEIFSLHTWDRVLADAYLPLYDSVVAETRRDGEAGRDGTWTRK